MSKQERTCIECNKELGKEPRASEIVQCGYWCCDEHYCSETCIEKTLDGESWNDHFDNSDSECYYTEWEVA